jgi:hypothetical protein
MLAFTPHDPCHTLAVTPQRTRSILSRLFECYLYDGRDGDGGSCLTTNTGEC